MKSLTKIDISFCDNLTELPGTLGHLQSLRSLTLMGCPNIKSLPPNMKNLHKLHSMKIGYCNSITELPVDLKVMHIVLLGNPTKFLPKGLDCQHLELHLACIDVHPYDSFSIQRISIDLTGKILPKIATIKNVNPSILSFEPENCLDMDYHYSYIYQLLSSLDELSVLMTLDLTGITDIKWLPLSITKPKQLQSLILPHQFRLESLPYHLNDSIIISVIGKHVRKTWKELKAEMVPGFFRVGGETLTTLRHLSLERHWDFEELSTRLDMLSNLESLDLDLKDTKFPRNMDLPVSLKYLSLCHTEVKSLPFSMEKLPNLKALNFYHCTLKGSNPLGNLSQAKLKLSHCGFDLSSPPTYLRHLEVSGILLLGISFINTVSSFQTYMNKFVCLETLSVTCSWIESFPSKVEPSNLRELRFKDCFRLEKLPPNLEDMVELQILDISGTRIKSLPKSILNLHKLEQLILPKGFKLNSLPISLKEVSVIDDTPEAYYQSYQIMDKKKYPFETKHDYDNLGFKTKRTDISKEMIESCWTRNMTLEEAATEFGVSRSTLKRTLKGLGLKWIKFNSKKRKHHVVQPSGNQNLTMGTTVIQFGHGNSTSYGQSSEYPATFG